MTDHVSRFFEIYDTDSALRRRVDEAVACYPGSLEIRESLVEAVLLPIAAELGLPFTVAELRARCPGLPAVASAYVGAHDARIFKF